MARIDEYQKWTPEELRHAIMECDVDDANSALSGVAVLCSMIAKLQSEIEQLKGSDADNSNLLEYIPEEFVT